jgi:gamma-glutamyl hydrolase
MLEPTYNCWSVPAQFRDLPRDYSVNIESPIFVHHCLPHCYWQLQRRHSSSILTGLRSTNLPRHHPIQGFQSRVKIDRSRKIRLVCVRPNLGDHQMRTRCCTLGWFSRAVPVVLHATRCFSVGTGAFRTGSSSSSLHSRIAELHTAAPVVGVLSEPGYNSQSHYIAASYIKWLEAGGARSIPIPYDASPALLDDIYGQINGLFLPGGSCDMPPGVPYLLDRILHDNRQGHYFPVWGTCLGFEFLIQYVGGSGAMQDGFSARNITLSLEHVQRKELYADPTTFRTVVEKPVAMNSHHQGIEPQHFLANPQLVAMWHITSTNHDVNGRPFVSTIEPIDPQRTPLYGVQYHPEKNAFEYSSYPGTNIPYEAIDHSAEGIAFSLTLAQFFVERVRHSQAINPHHDYTESELYPLMTTYPIQTGLHFEQIYVVPTAAHWNDTDRVTVE